MRTAGSIIALLLATAVLPAHAQNAADSYYDPAEMAAARKALHEGMGGQTLYLIEGDRLEYRTNEGNPAMLWDAQGWVGDDMNKAWFKTEGEYLFDDHSFEEAEVQALYGRTISTYFDLQAGIRHDFRPDPSRTFGVIGVQGLAPYWFELDAAAFVSEDGDVSARIEAEYELPITQRLILQPRTELNLAVQDVPELGIGSGLSTVDLGLRLRYEIVREFAPYVGVSWNRAVGETADFARQDGEDVSSVSFVAGVRFWY
ncbi:MAG: copper resistance protein CopB [Rhodospirillaceae bacterium]|nr:copper resistance protein CopB [Rhodospirillaceae bacterium]